MPVGDSKVSQGPELTDTEALSSSPLAALVYKSQATPHFDPDSLGELVSAAQARNAAEGLTGAVFYDDGQFLQWLEGPADRLDDVAASISRDQRHTDIELLSYGHVPARTYADWTMKLLTRKSGVQASTPRNEFKGDMASTIAARELAEGDDKAAEAFLRLAPPTVAGAVAQCEKIAAAYLPLWQSDLCSDVDITVGLSELLRLFRRHIRRFKSEYRSSTRRVLVTCAPGEPHVIGAAFAADMLLEKGAIVDYYLSSAEEDLIRHVAASPSDRIVIATSPVFSRAERLHEFSRLADAMVSAGATSNPSITIYGRAPSTLCGANVSRVALRAADISLGDHLSNAATSPSRSSRRDLLN